VHKIITTYLQDPEMEEMFDRFRPDMLTGGLLFFGFLINLVFYTLFGLLGGLVGVSLVGKARLPYEPPPDQPMPEDTKRDSGAPPL